MKKNKQKQQINKQQKVPKSYGSKTLGTNMCFLIPSSFTELENLEVSYLHRDVSNDPLHSPALVVMINHALIFTSILQKKKKLNFREVY